MKKLVLSLAVATLFVACNNAADTTDNAKDSLDSIANEKKDMIDSSADQRKDVIDSTTGVQKDALEKMDSANAKKDSATK